MRPQKMEEVMKDKSRKPIIDLFSDKEELSGYHFNAKKYKEVDGSITLSAADLDIVVNDENEKAAKRKLAENIKEYADEFYNEYSVWSKAPNRQEHIPFVFKALTLDTETIERDITYV